MDKNDMLRGLTESEVRRRTLDGRVNSDGQVRTKSVGEIIITNTFTFFNLLNVCLAAAVLLVGSYESVLFMGVVFWNLLIGVTQEIRAKRVVDRLTLISEPKSVVVRDGVQKEIDFRTIVEGDLLKISAGMQVCADCEIKAGECEVNESLLTGEAEPQFKVVSETLLSGSYIVSGEVYAESVRVGKENFSGQITAGARVVKRPGSKMFRSMDRIVKGISVIILPVMAALFYQSLFLLGEPAEAAVISVVAAVIGMIPEGLVLLISIVMAVGSLRLAGHRALVRDMYCIETLARVDVLCFDKTGTLTEGDMRVEELIPLGGQKCAEISKILSAFAKALPDANPTANAIRRRFAEETDYSPLGTVPFSSARKWSGVRFKGMGSYVLGAPEFILGGGISSEIKKKTEFYAARGKRVVLLARSDNSFNGRDLPDSPSAIALIVIGDSIRENAAETLEFFAENDVIVKIISGDELSTVVSTAKAAGLKNADNAIDMSKLCDEDIETAALEYTVFGRVSPQQKLAVVNALKKHGHIVGMTGDGVNDVPALKNADCSVAMQSGSGAARSVSDIVLLGSDFAAIPKIVAEGRRGVNNIERSASLFLTKTVFSLVVGFIYVFAAKPYPLVPIQMTFINALFIGLPGFLLALEPNTERIKGEFIENVLKKAVPYGFCHIACIVTMMVLGHIHRLTSDEIRSIAVLILGVSSLFILCRICVPFNKWRAAMAIVLGAAFAAGAGLFENLLEITTYSPSMLVVLLTLVLVSAAVTYFFPLIGEMAVKKYKMYKGKIKSGK